MITLEELWYAWCDIDEHTEAHLAFEGQFLATRGAFDKVMIILKG